MKKIFLTFLLGFSSISYAGQPTPTTEEKNPVSESNIVSSQQFFLSKPYDEKNIPQDLKKWIPWINKDNYSKDCVENFCVFIPKLIVSKNSSYKFTFEGTSLAKNSWIPLPSSENNWPLKVLINGQKAIIVNHEGKPFVNVSQKDFKIDIDYDSNIFDKSTTFDLPFSIVSFDNQTQQSLSLKNNSLSLNEIATTEEKNSFQEIKVFRKFTDSIPYSLDTSIQINFSGKNKEIDLGEVLPKDFKLIQINSDLKVTFKNNNYYINIVPGSHFINFKSFSNKELPTFSIKGLIKNIENEIWSIQKNNNIRNIDIASATIVDPKQVSAPKEWSNLPTYIVEDKLEITTSQQGISFNTDLKINAQRKSIFGFNNNVYSVDNISLENQYSKELKFHPDVLLQSVSLAQPKMIFKENNQNYILLNSNDKTGTIYFDNQKGENIHSQLSDSYYVNNWTTYFTPRNELLWTTNAKVTSYNFWFNSWNLYSLFSLSVLIIALYKLVGKEASAFALFSLVSFYYNNSVFWIFWILLVLSYSFNKYLPEKYENFKKNTNTISLIGTILVVIFVFKFVFNEIFSIIHPNISQKLYFSPLYYLGIIFTAFIVYKIFKKITSPNLNKKNKWITSIFFIIVLLFIFNGAYNMIANTYLGISASSQGVLSSRATIEENSPIMGVPQAPNSFIAGESVAENSIEVNKEDSLKDSQDQYSKVDKYIPLVNSKIIKRNIAQEKVQVGHAIMNLNNLHSYTLKPSNKESVHFYVANEFFVNLYGIFQSVFLLLLGYILIIYNIFIFKKEHLLEKLPLFLSQNFLTKKIQSKIIGG